MLGSPTITVKGRNLLAKIVAAKIPLTLSYIGLGDGLQEETEEVISLANEIMKEEIESCDYNEKEGQYYIRRVFNNAELEEGFYIREVGIYAIDPDEGEILYAYTNAGETGVDYFAPGKGKVIVKEIIEMATKFGNAENITVLIDPSVALATKEDINNLQAQIDEHKEEYTELKEDVEQLSNPSLLINGYFQIWQRGTSFNYTSSLGNKYGADRWRFNNYGAGSDINTQNIVITNTDTGIKITNANTGSTTKCNFCLSQPLEDFMVKQLRGKKVTLSMIAKGAISEEFRLMINDSRDDWVQENTNKIYIGNLTTEYNLYTVTCDIRNDATTLMAQFFSFMPVGAEIDIKYIKLEIGNKATPFYHRSYGEELALCQRYYCQEEWSNIINKVLFKIATNNCDRGSIYFPVTMRTNPTLDIIWSDETESHTNYIQAKGYDSLTPNGFTPFVNRTTEGMNDTNFVPAIKKYTADAEIY